MQCAVQSKYFVNMIRTLRPAYGNLITNRKALATRLLDDMHNEIISAGNFESETVVLIDHGKTVKIVTCSLSTVDGG